ncbi:OmpA family protein [Xylanibacter ruminicola]|uniref:OmpA family protein n=1 Tax=Xylanibacter ruminicola TaxID=839 RepID=A0A1M6Z431_XYLRU|nr:OmpA family protein [Xylanibacter ruminicola]SHL25160.1 OmpA family protein [Xylanibacter ruminicola]
MKENKYNHSFWPSYVDIMTTLFAIMLVLFAVSYNRFKVKEVELRKLADKYEEIRSIYQAVENIDSTYFEFNPKYVKHIFKLQVTFQLKEFSLYKLTGDADGRVAEADSIRHHIVKAGMEIKRTIEQLQKNDSIKGDIKYLVVIEGQASSDGYNQDLYRNNDVLSYQRALELNKFWMKEGIDFSNMDKCELVVAGSGVKGVPRDSVEVNNQRFLIHIVPVIGNIRMNNTD